MLVVIIQQAYNEWMLLDERSWEPITMPIVALPWCSWVASFSLNALFAMPYTTKTHKYPEIRHLPSFNNWILLVNGDIVLSCLVDCTNIAQWAIARAGLENVEPLQVSTREQSPSILIQWQHPNCTARRTWCTAVWERDMASQAISKFMPWMASHQTGGVMNMVVLSFQLRQEMNCIYQLKKRDCVISQVPVHGSVGCVQWRKAWILFFMGSGRQSTIIKWRIKFTLVSSKYALLDDYKDSIDCFLHSK